MNIPNSFKNQIADTFYDKEVTIFTTEDVVDDEGWARQETTQGESFMGNVNFSQLDEIRQEYGLTIDVVATITTDQEIANGTVLQFDDQLMRVTRAIAFDSHYLLICESWSSKSSTSPSA